MENFSIVQCTQIVQFYYQNDINWPSCSPDLTSPDFFLWEYLKKKVFVNKPQSLIELKENITRKIREIRPETLEKVIAEVIKRAQICEAENGKHMQDVVFHIYQYNLTKVNL